MSKMTPFEYGGFYDVPRCISVRYSGVHFLLQSWFDEVTDEYPSVYLVYKVSALAEPLPPCSPEFLKIGMTCIGEIPIEQIVFDPTRRKEIDALILDQFLREPK
jgi:hypothetical protein